MNALSSPSPRRKILAEAVATLALAACAARPSEPPKPVLVRIAPAASSVAPLAARLDTPAAPAAPKGALDPELARLRAASVRVRFPELDETPAGTEPTAPRLEAIRAAVGRATADMVVRYTGDGTNVAPVKPWQLEDGGHFNFLTEDPLPPSAPALALAKFGAVGNLCANTEDSIIPCVTRTDHAPPAVLPNTPGLVWEVFERVIVLVTFDGGSVELPEDPPPLARGAGPIAGWPRPVPDPVFGIMALMQGRFSSSSAEVRSSEELSKCADRAFRPYARKLADKTWAKGSDIDGWRASGLDDRQIAAIVVRKACGKKIEAWETAFAALLEERRLDREAIAELFKARVAALHAE